MKSSSEEAVAEREFNNKPPSRRERERERVRRGKKEAGGEFSHLIRARRSEEGVGGRRPAQGLTSRNITKICKYIERHRQRERSPAR